jgi:hypothetical protein
MSCSSSGEAVTLLMLKVEIDSPRSFDHFSDKSSLRAVAISKVWPGNAL